MIQIVVFTLFASASLIGAIICLKYMIANSIEKTCSHVGPAFALLTMNTFLCLYTAWFARIERFDMSLGILAQAYMALGALAIFRLHKHFKHLPLHR